MKRKFIIGFIVTGSLLSLPGVAQRRVEYDLYIRDTLVNYTGKEFKALAVNGQIPAPPLYFTEGDSAVIRVHNQTDRPTSIHWHGMLVSQEQDGVPYLTTAPVMPHSTHTYRFPIRQNGTYWYHSHFGFQEQEGLYGAIVVHKRPGAPYFRSLDSLPDYPIVLSDWTNLKAKEVNRLLHIGSDWFSIRKGSVQSYWEAVKAGHLWTKLKNEWKRMTAMDVSDVYYDCFLTNGSRERGLPQWKAGEEIRLRIVNGGASTYFWLQYAGGKIRVVAADGKDVVPVEVDRMLIAVSETYDIVLKVPTSDTAYQFLATAEDRSGSASLWLGSGKKKAVPALPRLNYFAGMKQMNGMMRMNGDMKKGDMPMGLQRMDMNRVMYAELEHKDRKPLSEMPGMEGMSRGNPVDSAGGMKHKKGMQEPKTLNYGMLRSPVPTLLPKKGPEKEIYLELTGNMDRYVWSLNHKTLSEAALLSVKEGENVRVIMYNNSMMRHPMHLHGHFFRLENGQGPYAPLKFSVDLMPMETDTIVFHADEQSRGNWFFHCHVLYHMMSGMGRIFRYEDSPPNPQLPDSAWAMRKVYEADRKFYFTIQNDFAINGNQGQLEWSDTRWGLEGEWQLGYKARRGYEAEARLGRYIGKKQWFYPYIGIDWSYRKGNRHEKNLFGQPNRYDRRLAGTLGVKYTLPLLFVAGAQVDTYGHIRLQLERDDIPLTCRLRLSVMGNTDRDYNFTFSYIFLPYLRISAGYDNDLKWGAGVIVKY